MQNSDSDEEESRERISVSAPVSNVNTKKSDIVWRHKPLSILIEPYSNNNNLDNELLTPISYFEKYIPVTLFDQMSEMTNLYAVQNHKPRFKHTCSSELQVLFGLHIAMGTLKLPRVSLFWDKAIGITMFQDAMLRDRFFELRMNLHLVNTLEIPDNCSDKLYKVRPLYDAVRSRCMALELEEHLCIDEQIVPFTGRFSIKQYMKGKPCPWGVKIFFLCGKSGLAYDFVIYQANMAEIDPGNQKLYGLAPSVVLQLAKRIGDEKGHKLYFDNYFSSYALFQVLLERGVYAAGTVRINRFGNTTLISDKDAMKKERGFCEEVTNREENVTLTKWVDNKTVVMGSNFVGKGKTDIVDRWSKTLKKYIPVERPEVVKLYNHGMDGVDLLDQLISYYRTFIKSKKWTLRMIFHAIDMAITLSWLEYRKDAEALEIPQKKQLDLLHFRMKISESLVFVGKRATTKKRGRPSLEENCSTQPVVQRRKGEVRPGVEVQQDGVDHMPIHESEKLGTRCKMPKCTGRSRILCQKCRVHLCLNKDKNCFLMYHTQ
ncbi:piggyBac transposable element-derived protein 3-like [Bacillus rossius redtenbacheri]|uniref:piggyBac transposable element-derived protein 3-like n=1 Tax=Bacillus rossius redtenbacheri TaxID=93214 RepID=UPI002FDD30A3